MVLLAAVDISWFATYRERLVIDSTEVRIERSALFARWTARMPLGECASVRAQREEWTDAFDLMFSAPSRYGWGCGPYWLKIDGGGETLRFGPNLDETTATDLALAIRETCSLGPDDEGEEPLTRTERAVDRLLGI